MIFTREILWIGIAIFLVTLLGFKKYIWFISLGYGFSIFIVGVMLLVLFYSELDFFKIGACGALILYGLRLGGFLLFREMRSSSYNEKVMKEVNHGQSMNFFHKVLMWSSCSLLYIFMVFPIVFRFVNHDTGDICFSVGLFIMLVGITFEAVSDFQKSRSKKRDCDQFCHSGLFNIVRCPNYLGELIIWSGVFISGFTTLSSAGQWIFSMIGFLGIIYVMFSGARRLEIRQDKEYGKDLEYQRYVSSTPILIPFIPLYSVKKYKWLVA